MRYLLLLVLMVFMSACDNSAQRQMNDGLTFNPLKYRVHPNSDPKIIPYLQRFAYEAERFGLTISVNNIPVYIVEDMDYKLKGVCYYDRIELNKRSLVFGILDNEIIIFHELGHCLLGRSAHLDDMVPTLNLSNPKSNRMVPLSIMNSSGVDGWTYEKNWTSYMKELFWGQKFSKLRSPFDFSAPDDWSDSFYTTNFPEHCFRAFCDEE